MTLLGIEKIPNFLIKINFENLQHFLNRIIILNTLLYFFHRILKFLYFQMNLILKISVFVWIRLFLYKTIVQQKFVPILY